MISVAFAHGEEINVGPVSIPIDFLLMGIVLVIVFVIEYRRRRKK
jgi:hypothetical protein